MGRWHRCRHNEHQALKKTKTVVEGEEIFCPISEGFHVILKVALGRIVSRWWEWARSTNNMELCAMKKPGYIMASE